MENDIVRMLFLRRQRQRKKRKIKTISGAPPLSFKAKAGALKNYRLYGNTETLTRSYSGSAPLSFPIVDGSVSNYRIYGNTVNGESVGELVTDSQSEHYGEYAIPITNNSETANIYLDEPLAKSGDNADYIDYAEQKRYNADGTSEDVTLPALPTQSSTNSLSVGTSVQPSSLAVDVSEVVSCGDRTGNLFDIEQPEIKKYDFEKVSFGVYTAEMGSSAYNANRYRLNTETGKTYFLEGKVSSGILVQLSSFLPGTSEPENGVIVKPGTISIAFIAQGLTTLSIYSPLPDKTVTIKKLQIIEGSTALPYEPYGYKIPVTLTADSAETTDIYLDTPLAKSGNNADYIDYATQKRHNSDGTESSVTLPEIAVTAGTNTLSVGTEVQPSGVEITGKIKSGVSYDRP